MEYYQDIEIQSDRYEEEQRILAEIHLEEIINQSKIINHDIK